MKDKSLRVLIVEDSEDDALLIIRELKKGGYDLVSERVETAATMKKALKEKPWDIILCDYKLPKFNAPSAIAVLKKTNIDIPVIIVSGTIGETVAIDCMRLGAQDYIMKGNLSRLCPAIARELEDAEVRNKEKHTKEKLRYEEQRFRALADHSSDIIVVVNREGVITYENPAVERILGFKLKERIGARKSDNLHPEDLKLVTDSFNTLLRDKDAPVQQSEVRLRHKDGSWRNFESIASHLVHDDIIEAVIINLHDITERKRTEEEMRKSEEKYRLIFEYSPLGLLSFDEKGVIVACNDNFVKIIGSSQEKLIGLNMLKLPDKNMVSAVQKALNGSIGMYEDDYSSVTAKKITPVRCIFAPMDVGSGRILGGVGIIEDITERKRTEDALRESEELYRTIFENTGTSIILIEEDMTMSMSNGEFVRNTGYSPDEINGRMKWTEIIHPDDLERMVEQHRLRRESQGGALPSYEFRYITKKGDLRDTLLTIKLVPGTKKSIASLIDITERKKSEEALKNSEAKYRNIFENAIEGIYQSTIEGRFITANAAFARMAGYDSPEELIESIKDIGTQLYVHPEDRKRFMEIRDAKGFVDGFEVEFYKKDGSTFWVVVNARRVKDEKGKILYTEGLIEDITIRKHAEEKLQQTLGSLRNAVGVTIQVLVSAVEARDPYTAGHQIRSADLARAIATEMGLCQDKIEGIRIAGSIHDIGKLSIPAEILSKPTKLTALEFSLIKGHSQSGYEMLKNVESPWPLAQIVYQHHERMNGSGYPRNLKGEEILLDARIMAVADVVEAMASHRPYRPGLGIEAALEEIKKNKGIIYDNAVADACLRLFCEKGYHLK